MQLFFLSTHSNHFLLQKECCHKNKEHKSKTYKHRDYCKKNVFLKKTVDILMAIVKSTRRNIVNIRQYEKSL